jgi:hypothetical protein
MVITATAVTATTAASASGSATTPYSIHDVVLNLSGGETKSGAMNPRKRVTSILTNKLKLPSKQSLSAFKVGAEKQVLSKGVMIAQDATTDTDATVTDAAPAEEIKEDPKMKVLIRLLFLLYYGSLGSLMPYLPVYYHHLGHGGQVIGLLGAVKPFTTFLVAPVWGLIADQTQNPFLILQVTFIVSLLGQLFVSVRTDAYFGILDGAL